MQFSPAAGGFDQLVAIVPNGSILTLGEGLSVNGLADAKFKGLGNTGRVLAVEDDNLKQETLAHELAHNLGRHHPNTSDSCGANDDETDWPKNRTTSTIDINAFDTFGAGVALRRTKKDTMTYCANNVWVSEFTYKKLIDSRFLSQRLTKESHGEVRQQSTPVEALIIRGSALRDGSSGRLFPAYRVNTILSPQSSASDATHCIRLNGEGGVLNETCFSLEFTDTETGVEQDEQFFSFVMPRPAGLHSVSLMQSDRELASIMSNGAPNVTITSPVSGERWSPASAARVAWSGADPEGDLTAYAALYSPDDGETWIPLAVDITDTQITVDPAELQGSSIRVRVLSAAGLDTAQAEVGPIILDVSPRLETTPSGTATVGSTIEGRARETEVKISNAGTGWLTVRLLEIRGANADAFELGAPPVPFELAPGESRLLQVRYAPTAMDIQQAELVMHSNSVDGAEKTLLLRAEGFDGEEPRAEASANLVEFGEVVIGQTKTLDVGIAAASLMGLTVERLDIGDAQFQASVSGFSIGSGEEQRVQLGFTPNLTGDTASALVVHSNDPNSPLTIALIGTGLSPSGGTGPMPAVNTGGVVDAASFQAVVALGGIGSLFGVNLADGVQIATDVPLPIELGGGRVRVDGHNAPLFFVSSTQINFQVPFEVRANATVEVVVSRNGVESPPVAVQVSDYAPGVFTNPNTSEPIIQRHPDGALITADNPAQPGDVLIISLTGIGDVSNPPPTGTPALASPLATANLTPTVTVGDVPAQVLFAGLTPFFVGLGQVNIQLPDQLLQTAALHTGFAQGATLPLVIAFGESRSQPVNLPIAGTVTPGPQPPPMPEPPPDGTSVQVVPNPVDFGQVQVGDTAELSVSIRNGGTERITLSDATSDNSAFVVDGPFGSLTIRIGPDTAIRIKVRFTPSSRGPVRAMLTIVSDDPVSPMLKVLMVGDGT